MNRYSKMKILGRVVLIKLLLLIGIVDVFAQGPGNPGGPPICFPPPCVPVTDHIEWLFAALVIFGIYKGYKYTKDASVKDA